MTDTIRPRWICIAILDNLAHWKIEPEDAPFIKAIESVYFYDANERTNCCEIAPSYFLRALRHSIVLEQIDIPEDVRERLNERYESQYPEDCYMHCSVVDRMTCPRVEWGPVSDDTTEEAVLEYWQSNHVL